jgi:hypothetical protein
VLSESLQGSAEGEDLGWHPVDEIHNIGYCINPIMLRDMGTNEKSSSSFKNMSVFTFCHTILLWSTQASSLMENTIVLKEIVLKETQEFRVKIFSTIV